MTNSKHKYLGVFLLVVGLLYLIASIAAMYQGHTVVGGIGLGLATLFGFQAFDHMEGNDIYNE